MYYHHNNNNDINDGNNNNYSHHHHHHHYFGNNVNLSDVHCFLEKLKGKGRDLSECDKFVNNYMASLSEKEKLRSPLSNMALATQAWREKQKKPISQRVINSQKKQEAELETLGFDTEFTSLKHVNFGLASPLESMFPQLPAGHLKKHLTDANGQLDDAVDAILLEIQTQDSFPNQLPPDNEFLNTLMLDTTENSTQNTATEEMLAQMFPQYSREGILCAIQACGNNMYNAVDLLLKLLPKESRRQDAPKVISFSQSASTAVDHIPNTQLNPIAMTLISPSGNASTSRKCHFCKKCGHQVPSSNVLGSTCPNPSCGYPLPENIRM